MKKIGIVLDPTTGDLQVSGGALVIGNVTAQNKAQVLLAHPAAFKLAPTVGVGLADMVNDNDALHWRTEIRKQLTADGMTVQNVKIVNDEILIDAQYPT